MKSLGTEKIQCLRCKTELDVPVYINGDEKKYGFKFCHQCGERLFDESVKATFINRDFLRWLSNHYLQLSDEQILQICKRICNEK